MALGSWGWSCGAMRVSLPQAAPTARPLPLSINPLCSPGSDCELLWEAQCLLRCRGLTHIMLGQLLQQGPGLLEVDGVNPLGEPAVDLRQHLPSFVLLSLLLPHARHTHRHA